MLDFLRVIFGVDPGLASVAVGFEFQDILTDLPWCWSIFERAPVQTYLGSCRRSIPFQSTCEE